MYSFYFIMEKITIFIERDDNTFLYSDRYYDIYVNNNGKYLEPYY